MTILEQNITAVSDLLRSINASVTNDMEVISLFDGTVNDTTVTDVQVRLANISMQVSNLNTTLYNLLQTLQQSLVEAVSLQNDFDSARNNVTESLMRINEATRLLSVAENLINRTTVQNLDNRNNLSLLSADIPVLQNNLQTQMGRVQSYEIQLNSTYLRAVGLLNTLTQSEQELLNASVIIEQLYNYSNISLDLTSNAVATLQNLQVSDV